MTVTLDYGGRSKTRDKRITEWDARQLSRFCEVGYGMARRQFEAKLNDLLGAEQSPKEGLKGLLLTGLMEELEILAENLIVLALDYGHLQAGKLKQKQGEEKEARRSLILTEMED